MGRTRLLAARVIEEMQHFQVARNRIEAVPLDSISIQVSSGKHRGAKKTVR